MMELLYLEMIWKCYGNEMEMILNCFGIVFLVLELFWLLRNCCGMMIMELLWEFVL